MILFAVFLCSCLRSSVDSADIYGVEITTTDEWWNDNYFLKFNTPSGKVFYIDRYDGTIYREKEQTFGFGGYVLPPPPLIPFEVPTTEAPPKDVSPFISFVSIELKIYDIYFENDLPKIEKSKFTYNNKDVLTRHRLDSFVGPNKKIYRIIYNNGNVSVTSENSMETLHNFQIKTFGPYEKWEHTYDFTENGEFVTDHSISPIDILPNRSILLPELKPNDFLNDYVKLFIKLNTPYGKEYHITSQGNIVQIRNDNATNSVQSPFITFTEPNGKTYAVLFRQDDHPSIMEEKYDETYFNFERLHSFVGPNGIMYRIDRKTKENDEVPVLVPESRNSSDLQITALTPNQHYNKYSKYVFSNNGSHLFDRVDEIDWTPLNEQPSLPIEEVAASSEIIDFPFLSFYSPSGKNYHIIANETHPNIEEEVNPVEIKESFNFTLQSFATPNQKAYSIKWTLTNESAWTPHIRLPSQVRDPIDEPIEDGLSITIQRNDGRQFIYRFSWTGDKLIKVEEAPPRGFLDPKVLQSLIGK